MGHGEEKSNREALNVLLGLLTRAIDYTDALLANRYTYYAGVPSGQAGNIEDLPAN